MRPASNRAYSAAKHEPVHMSSPIDLVHLAKQTLGDRSLEQEVLRLFRTQATIFIERMEAASTSSERYQAAHTIKGSARNIGAWGVANIASDIETANDNEAPQSVARLRMSLNEACTFINKLLEDA